MEVSTENIERQFMRWTSSFNSKFDSMQSLIEDLQSKNEYLTTKNKHIEANLLEKNKLIKHYHSQIDILNNRLLAVEDRFHPQIVSEDCEEKTVNDGGHQNLYESKLKEKDLEIQSLKTEMSHQKTSISVCKEEMKNLK